MIKFIAVVIAIVAGLLILFTFRDTRRESVNTLLSEADALERHREILRHRKLQDLKSNPKNILKKFTTDGCSGGLSVGWEYLAGVIPNFQEIHGSMPAWQSCCVMHDRAYHAGGSQTVTAEMSFEARRHADLALKACVIETGIKRGPELTKEYSLSDAELKRIYNGIANMMYGAVRLGGMPCSDLPWRWGYGWPQCK